MKPNKIGYSSLQEIQNAVRNPPKLPLYHEKLLRQYASGHILDGRQVKTLEKAGFLTKSGKSVSLTFKGRIALASLQDKPDE